MKPGQRGQWWKESQNSVLSGKPGGDSAPGGSEASADFLRGRVGHRQRTGPTSSSKEINCEANQA